MAQLPLSTRRRLARGLTFRQIGAWRGRYFSGLGNRASLTTAQGSNRDLTFFAHTPGVGGNSITVRYVNPGTNNATLSVSVVSSAITVNLATNGSAVATSTAAAVKDAVNRHVTAGALVYVQNAPASDATGVVAALAATNLAGATARGAY